MDIDYDQIDLSRISKKLIDNNYVFGLGFPSSSETEWVVLRAIGVGKLNYWLYDPIAEGFLQSKIAASTTVNGITGHTYIDAARPSSVNVTSNKTFIFEVPKPTGPTGTLYQLFFGVSPDWLRILFNQPSSQSQMGLPPQNPGAAYNQYGAIRAKDTPLLSPGPDSEVIVPPGLDFGIGFINDVQKEADPLLMWYVNYLRYEIVSDANIVHEVLHTTKYRSLKMVGGISSYNYNIKANFGVDPLTLGMDKSEIQSIVGGL